tara:strand:- start:2165 stop:2494 length:330 start_codon:yes stop_codon:yes gene_type:complete
MVVLCTIFVAPVVMFSQVILVPGFAAWLSLFTLFDNVVMNPNMGTDNYAYNLVGLLNVTGAPLVLMYLMYRILKLSYKNSIWIINRFKIKPQMNLVLFNNDKKLCELKF